MLIKKWIRAKVLRVGTAFHDDGLPQSWTLPVIPESVHVRAVAAQLRSVEEAQQRIRMAAGADEEFPEISPPSGLMLMSGSHPLRLLIKQKVNSTKMIALARELRTQGVISKELQLWTVGDPGQGASLAADDCERKIHAGADVIVTQPPLKNGSLEAFAAEIKSRNLHLQAKFVIGVPVFGSLRDVEFWGKLCRFDAEETSKLKEQLSTRESRASYTKRLVTRLEEEKGEFGIGGAHIMAPTPEARREAIIIFAEENNQGTVCT